MTTESLAQSMDINPERSIKCVSTIFPVFTKDVDEHNTWYQNSSKMRGKMRAAHEGKFELYFMFDLDDIKVPKSIVNSYIYDYDVEALGSVIKEVNKQGNIVYLLEEIRALTDSIPYDRLGILASALMDSQGGFPGETTRAFFTFSASDMAEHCTQEIIRKLKTEDERYSIIHNFAERIDKNGIGALARIIHTIELGYGRLTGRAEKKQIK